MTYTHVRTSSETPADLDRIALWHGYIIGRAMHRLGSRARPEWPWFGQWHTDPPNGIANSMHAALAALKEAHEAALAHGDIAHRRPGQRWNEVRLNAPKH